MNLSGDRFAARISVEPCRLQSWSVVGKGAYARLLGILREQAGEPQDRWVLSPPLRRIDFEACRAETEGGTRWELLLPMRMWSDEARSALRAHAALAGLNVADLETNALVRPDENLGGVSDQAWIRTQAIARALQIRPPQRDVASVQSFNALHGPAFMSNRLELVCKLARPTPLDRSRIEIPEFREADVRARVSTDFRSRPRPMRRVPK